MGGGAPRGCGGQPEGGAATPGFVSSDRPGDGVCSVKRSEKLRLRALVRSYGWEVVVAAGETPGSRR